jgi:PAS domain S-box-containing protein
MARANREQPGRHEFILRLTDELRRVADPAGIEQHACATLGAHLSADFAYYAEHRLDEGLVVIDPGYSRAGARSAAGRYGIADLGDPASDIDLSRPTVVVPDTASSEILSARARATYLTLGMGAFVTTTVAGTDAAVRRLLVGTGIPRAWTSDEIALIEDVGDRVNATVERAVTASALRASEERFRAALDIETVAVIHALPDGTIVSVNDTFLRISGFDRYDVALGLLRLDDVIPADQTAAARRAAAELLETGVARPYERQYLRVDGSRWWALVTAKQLADDLIIEVAVDITTQKASERFRTVLEDEHAELLRRERAAREAAEAALRARDQFLADVSHELRTPLAAILLWSRLLASGSVDGREAEAAATIQRNAEAQRLLIDELLDASRIMAGTTTVTLRPARVDHVVREAVDALMPLAAERQIRLEHRVTGEVVAQLDAPRFAQVIRNLVDNAIRYSKTGTLILIETRAEEESCLVVVEDNGIGIDRDLLPHVFDRFRRGNSSPQEGGLGLGLSIARELVELHGGSISATSAGPGYGATFTVRLPLRKRKAATKRSRPNDGAAPSRRRAPRVLSGDTGGG